MDLSGKLLIAMPGMADPRFEHSVVFLCAHSADGAMGLIVNKPARDLSFDELQSQLGIARSEKAQQIRVHFGGPVEHSRGFVLHSADYGGEGATLKVDDSFGMTGTVDILQAIADGEGPAVSILALGYAGWGPGQLENEILANGWLTSDADPELVFSSDDDRKWTRALNSLGVDPITLSAAAGRA
ncbi:MAG: YqgE/AlgH family protein [Albidovulum sp.]